MEAGIEVTKGPSSSTAAPYPAGLSLLGPFPSRECGCVH